MVYLDATRIWGREVAFKVRILGIQKRNRVFNTGTVRVCVSATRGFVGGTTEGTGGGQDLLMRRYSGVMDVGFVIT